MFYLLCINEIFYSKLYHHFHHVAAKTMMPTTFIITIGTIYKAFPLLHYHFQGFPSSPQSSAFLKTPSWQQSLAN